MDWKLNKLVPKFINCKLSDFYSFVFLMTKTAETIPAIMMSIPGKYHKACVEDGGSLVALADLMVLFVVPD